MSDLDLGIASEMGEWARLEAAERIRDWSRWNDAAFVIGPVAMAYEGINPIFDRQVFFEKPTLMICASLRLSPRVIDLKDDVAENGLCVECPLVYDGDSNAYGEIIDVNGETVNHLWVDFENARVIRALKGAIPFIDLAGNNQDLDASTLRLLVL